MSLAHHQEPFHEEFTWAIPPLVLQGKRPSYPSDVNKEYEAIMKRCWDQNPDARPSFSELVCIFENLLEDLK